MKFFGAILISSYFLARERELFSESKNLLVGLLRDWAVYALCAGAAVVAGVSSGASAAVFQPVWMLGAALLPVLFFRGRTVCALLGAFTGFCVLRAMPDLGRVALLLFAFEIAVLVGSFFYQGARERMLRLFTPPAVCGALGALLLFFGLAVTCGLFYQKAIQIF